MIITRHGKPAGLLTVRLVRIGNSRGIRIPQEMLRLYGLQEGAELELEERREGMLIRVARAGNPKIGWEPAYREMAAEAAEHEEWAEWDATAEDGREG